MRGLRMIAKTDLELRSSPADKKLVLERLVLGLAGSGRSEEIVV
jgi:DNA polymerase-3 subunit delta